MKSHLQGKIVLIGLGLIVTVQAFILWPYKDFIQVWDGFWYWQLCLKASLGEIFNVMDFNCSDHPNMGFFLPLAGFLRSRILDPFHTILLYQLALSSLSILAFYGISKSIINPSSLYVTLLSTFAWAMHPLLLANTLITSPELASTTFLLLSIWAITYQKLWLIPIFGTFFIFTKEPMILMYGLLLLPTTIFFLPKVNFTRSFFIGFYQLFRKIEFFLVPLFLLVIYAYLRVHFYHLNLFHGATSRDPDLQISVGTFLKILPLSAKQVSILAMIFLNSFFWIPSLLIALGFIKWCYHSIKSSSLVAVSANTIIIAFTFIIGLYSLTRVIPYTNSRYLLPLIPLTLLLTPVAMSYLRMPQIVKATILLSIICLFVQSQTKTFDPIATWFFGTFKIGSRSILSVTSYSGECCGPYGRDQLVYNLEFAKIFELQDLTYAAIKPTSNTVIVYPDQTLYHTTGNLDPTSFKRTYRETSVKPKFIGNSAVENSNIDNFYFISAPNSNPQRTLESFRQKYRLEEKRQVSLQEYSIDYYKFAIKKP